MLIRVTDNTTTIPGNLGLDPFIPRSIDITTNALFSVSLTLSLISAFGTLLAQQWLVSYKQVPAGVPNGPGDRSLRHHRAKTWGLRGVVETFLPTLLQFALLVFMVGFLLFLRDLDTTLAIPNFALIVAGGGAFLFSVVLSLCDKFCPYQSPLSSIIRFMWWTGINPVIALVSLLRTLQDTPPRFWLPLLGRIITQKQLSLRERRLALWKTLGLAGTNLFNQCFQANLSSEDIPQDRKDKLQMRFVRKTLENTSTRELLLTTAANIPLLTSSQLDLLEQSPRSSHSQRLRGLASTGGSSGERNTFLRAFTHVLMAESLDGLGTSWTSQTSTTFIAGTNVHIRNPHDPRSVVTCSLAGIAIVHLAQRSDDDIPQESKDNQGKAQLEFLSQAVTRDGMPELQDDHASALGMVAWTAVARARGVLNTEMDSMFEWKPWWLVFAGNWVVVALTVKAVYRAFW